MIKVLIADDEPLLLRSLKKSIEMMDGEYSVIDTASDGKSALKKAEALNRRFSTVLNLFESCGKRGFLQKSC